MKYHNIYVIAIAMLSVVMIACNTNQMQTEYETEINTGHLDHLYEDIVMDSDTVGVVHIYCEYPDYKWVDDSDEGMACVDDVARAAVFYMKNYDLRGRNEDLMKSKKLLKFILKMHADNGWFYNFIFGDYTINKIHQNSVPRPGWWTWRAVWALSEGYKTFIQYDAAFAETIKSHLDLTVKEIKQYLNQGNETRFVEGLEIPTWLPYGSASDQGALLILCLGNYSEIFNDDSVHPYIENIADGIVKMQKGSKNEFPYGALMSWENYWHGWGNLQAYSLQVAAKLLKNEKYNDAALYEINNFYQYLLNKEFIQEFSVSKTDNKYEILTKKKYPQIAYQLRAMIYATLEAYKNTSDENYLLYSEQILKWFYGNNDAKSVMYDINSGRCNDGIISDEEVNHNAGAESTIEALLSLIQYEAITK